MNISNLKIFIKDIKNNSFHCADYMLCNDVEKTLSKNGIHIRKIFAPLFRLIYKTQSDYKIKVVEREPLNKDGLGKIFVGNHRQSDDAVFSAIVANESAYYVFGNKYLLLDSFANGFGVWAYGGILLNRDDKDNRHACIEKMKFILRNGGNIIIFPEGYWNLSDNGLSDEKHYADDHNSDNWLIQDFNIGAFKVAQECGASIVPLIFHYDEVNGKNCYAKRCKEFKIEKNEDVFESKNKIHDYMVNEYYELMCTYSTYKREKLESDGITLKKQWKNLKKELIDACDISSIGYHLDLVDEKLIGKAKTSNSIITNEEAFDFMENLEVKRENAFLLSKRLVGRKKNYRL